MNVSVEFNFNNCRYLQEFSKKAVAESTSQAISDIVLRVLVDLFRRSSQKTVLGQYIISSPVLLTVRQELLLYLGQNNDTACEKLKQQVILSIQNILESRSPLYKVERLMRSLEGAKSVAKETINFLAQSLIDVMVERSNVMKLYEHVMTRLFLSCIQEQIQNSESCFTHSAQGDLTLDHSKLPQMTPESFSLTACLEHAKKMKVKTLQEVLARILQEMSVRSRC